MTGFPGESEAEFAETVAFIREQPFTYLHVFTYSERPGTSAAAMPGVVPVERRRERTRMLRALSDEKNLQFRRRMLGQILSAVTLEERGMALTTNFLKVRMREERAPNRLIELEIGLNTEAGLWEKAVLPVLA
jgi:threonylcarbamoyladenosine tRNA methylthiotransferase MtaB